MEGDVITMQDIFVFEQTGMDEDGKVIGQLNRPASGRSSSKNWEPTVSIFLSRPSGSNNSGGEGQCCC